MEDKTFFNRQDTEPFAWEGFPSTGASAVVVNNLTSTPTLPPSFAPHTRSLTRMKMIRQPPRPPYPPPWWMNQLQNPGLDFEVKVRKDGGYGSKRNMLLGGAGARILQAPIHKLYHPTPA